MFGWVVLCDGRKIKEFFEMVLDGSCGFSFVRNYLMVFDFDCDTLIIWSIVNISMFRCIFIVVVLVGGFDGL